MKSQVLIDYFTFTVKVDDPALVIKEYLGMDPNLFSDTGYGLMGYEHCMEFSDIKVLYEARENDYFQAMGVCVSMSGKGCRTFERFTTLGGIGETSNQITLFDSSPFLTLFQRLAGDANCNITRVDVACDEFEGWLDMDDIIQKTQNNEINSRMTKRQVVVSYDGARRNGATVYLGSPSSEFRVRIYDKALEQGEDRHWIRVELVFRGDHASAFVDQAVVFGEVGRLAAQVVNDKFSFIEKDDSNISRCTVSEWWNTFLEDLGQVTLVSRETVQHKVEEIEAWLDYQIGPSLAIILKTMGRARLFQIAVDANSRLSQKQEALIEDYNKVQAAMAVERAERRYQYAERAGKALC